MYERNGIYMYVSIIYTLINILAVCLAVMFELVYCYKICPLTCKHYIAFDFALHNTHTHTHTYITHTLIHTQANTYISRSHLSWLFTSFRVY